MLIACPGSSAVRRVGFASFFCHLGLYGFPETGIFQDPPHGVGTHYRFPVVAFGQLVGDPFLAPIGMLSAQLDYLPFDLRRSLMTHFRFPAGKGLQARIALLVEAGLPVVERATAHVCFPARFSDVPGGFPSLKQKPALL